MTLNGHFALNSVSRRYMFGALEPGFRSLATLKLIIIIIIIIIIINIYLRRVYKSNNNSSEQTVGQNSKTQGALITAHKNDAIPKKHSIKN